MRHDTSDMRKGIEGHPCEATDFYRLGINNEKILTAIHHHGKPLAYLLTQTRGLFSAVIELFAQYKVGDLGLVLLQPVIKKPFLTVYAL